MVPKQLKPPQFFSENSILQFSDLVNWTFLYNLIFPHWWVEKIYWDILHNCNERAPKRPQTMDVKNWEQGHGSSLICDSIP